MTSPVVIEDGVPQAISEATASGNASSRKGDIGAPITGDPPVGPETTHSMSEPETIQALPPPPANLAGSSNASGKHFNVTVSNKVGYLCHVLVETNWPVSPEVPFAIFTHPDNSALFRDVKRVGARKVLKTEPGYKEVEVEQLGDVQFLWIHRTYSTWLHVVEDARDPECLRITFELLRSDVLGRFSGRWELRPVRDPATGRVVGCRGELHQDVLPKGMPSFMANLPVLGGALRAISVRAVTRVLEDFAVAMEKVRAGHAAGRSTEAVLRELCGSVSEAAHANGAVTSFAFDPADGEEDEEGDGQEDKASQESAGRADERRESGGEPAAAPLKAAAEAPEAEMTLGGDETCRVGSGHGGERAVMSAATIGAPGPAGAVTVVATAAVGAGSD